MRKVLLFLRQEILWGKMAGIAAVAALASLLLEDASGALAFLQGFSLFVFAVAGMFVYRSAKRHPFWNALVCAFFAALFYLLLYQMAWLGEHDALRPLAEIAPWLPYMGILITVETFVGTGVFYLARRFAERARAQGGGQKQQPPAQGGEVAARKGAVSEKEPTRPGRTEPRPGKTPPRRPGTKP